MYKDELYGQIGDFNLPSLSHKLALLREGWVELPDSTPEEESAKLKEKIRVVEGYLAQFETKIDATEALLKYLSREDSHDIIAEYWRGSREIKRTLTFAYGYLRF